MIEIDEGPLRPDFGLQFFTGHDLARSLQKCLKDEQGLFLQSDSDALLAQFAGAEIQLEDSEANGFGG
jgi:hypothetical protein